MCHGNSLDVKKSSNSFFSVLYFLITLTCQYVFYASAMVTSTSTPGSMLMEVICLTISDGLWRSIRRLWIRIWYLLNKETDMKNFAIWIKKKCQTRNPRPSLNNNLFAVPLFRVLSMGWQASDFCFFSVLFFFKSD